jgi:hypothetical protein
MSLALAGIWPGKPLEGSLVSLRTCNCSWLPPCQASCRRAYTRQIVPLYGAAAVAVKISEYFKLIGAELPGCRVRTWIWPVGSDSDVRHRVRPI